MTERSGHVWALDADGEIDVWRLDAGYCNGPYCLACKEAFCKHCHPDIYTDTCDAVIEGVAVVVRPMLEVPR
jgi:hypothetical protein